MTPEQATQKLFEAARSGNVSAARAAIHAGAEVNVKDFCRQTPLHWAALHGHTEVTHLLIEKGADLNAKDYYQRTPLHWAAENGHTNVPWLLIENGAELNAKDSDRRTPLHLASLNVRTDIVQPLIEKGADPNARDLYQRTPLHWAAIRAHTAVARLLADKEAANAKDGRRANVGTWCRYGNRHAICVTEENANPPLAARTWGANAIPFSLATFACWYSPSAYVSGKCRSTKVRIECQPFPAGTFLLKSKDCLVYVAA